MLDAPYRSANKLVKWMTILLVANAVVCVFAAGLGWREIQVIEELAEFEAEATEPEAELGEETADLKAKIEKEIADLETEFEEGWEEEWLDEDEESQSWVDAYITTGGFLLIGIMQSGVGITLIVLFCLWIPRANRNARALGATGMRFTPRWCVIWYLIPIMNLFKPYQAMKEIWQASAPSDPTPWQQRVATPLLGWWWILWLVSGLASRASFRFSWSAESWDEYLTASWITLVSDTVDIPLAIVAMMLVRSIHRMQEHSRYTTAFD